MKIAVLSPHRGDAAFSLSLTIGLWIQAGHKVHAVNCFSRSEHAPFSDAGSVHSNDRMSFVTALRGREDETWRRQFGPALTLTDLNMKDAPLRLHCAADEVYGLTVNPADKAILKIRKALDRIAVNVVALPLALSGHVDALIVREALAATLPTTMPCAFYEDLPYAAALETAGAIEAAVRDVERSFNTQLEPRFASGPVDESAAAERKRRLALCYDSQIDDETVERIAQFCRRHEGRERLWANPAWSDAGPKVFAPL